MKRTIYLPALERSVTLGAYVAAVKKAKQFPAHEFKHGLTCWWPVTGQQIVNQFREGMHERISKGTPYYCRGYTYDNGRLLRLTLHTGEQR